MFWSFNEPTIFLVSVKIQSEKCTGAVAPSFFIAGSNLMEHITQNTQGT